MATSGGAGRAATPPWSWLALALAVAWVVLVRIPLVLNAPIHLDSDLAVDGLTLLDATRGQWRWHYPGTPHMGIIPVLLSLPQALVLGATPAMLVSGGTVAYALVVVATFLLALRLFGPKVAAWSLVPLAFASIGTVWLSSRITGGHLLTVAWFAALLLLLAELIERPRAARVAALGLACGLGVYLDRMLLFPAVTIVVPAVYSLVEKAGQPVRLVGLLAVATAVGFAPAAIGQAVDPYDAYGSQFETILTASRGGEAVPAEGREIRALAREHLRILTLECLPRLIAGRSLPGFVMEPHPAALQGQPVPRRPESLDLVTAAGTLGVLAIAAASFLALPVAGRSGEDHASSARGVIVGSLLITSIVTLVLFVLNRHIYNSDNYRYLVLLLLPWAFGYGWLMDRLTRAGSGGKVLAAAAGLALALAMTGDTLRYYRRFGWLDGLRPVAQPLKDPALDWLRSHSHVDAIFGDYWDVYRLSLLTGRRVEGVPYPNYPNRFPGYADTLPGNRPRTLFVRPTGPGPFYRREAESGGARLLDEAQGVAIYDWPREGDDTP